MLQSKGDNSKEENNDGNIMSMANIFIPFYNYLEMGKNVKLFAQRFEIRKVFRITLYQVLSFKHFISFEI